MFNKYFWIILAVAVIYFMFRNDFRRKKNEFQKKQGKENVQSAGELVKDPVCGAYVSVADSISVRDGNKVHRFCSYECRDKFLDGLQSNGREIPEKNNDNA